MSACRRTRNRSRTRRSLALISGRDVSHAGRRPAPKRDEPNAENSSACVHCGAPADGIDAAVEAPACRPCATGRSDDSRVPYDGPAVQCDRCGRGLEIVVWRDCGLERIWYPSDGRRKHKHERVTDHEVAYEAADELARPDRGVDLRNS